MDLDLLQFTDRGIYCEPAGVYLDPWKPVPKALITHAHADHARWGMKQYLAHKHSEPIMRLRLGADISLQTVEYGEVVTINGVKFSFHPAGHIIGSSQIRVEHNGEVWVFTGDYKLENDGFSQPFEPVKCHTLITESTFGLPVYRWKPQAEIMNDIGFWWKSNAEQGVCSVLLGYSLGKAQRLLLNVDRSIGPVYVHEAINNIHVALQDAGIDFPEFKRVEVNAGKETYRNALIVAPPGVNDSAWLKRFEPYSIASASGWMSLRGTRRRQAVDRGFALSDHADWAALNTAVKESGASKVLVTHGYSTVFAKWLTEQGLEARDAHTAFSDETEDLQPEIARTDQVAE